ncbi:MAG: D-2-hydroxyacid dehydrogenase [Candidatus Acetothermia bacterium]
MAPKILICDPIAEEGVQKLRDAGFELEIKTDLSSEELREEVRIYNAMVVRSATKVREPIIDAADNLEIVVRAGVGLDNIDVDYAENKGIQVSNTPEASSNSVAELALGHMLSLARNIAEGTVTLKEGKWAKSDLKGIELAGKTLGVIGIGRIGILVADKADALGMEVLAYDKFISDPPRDHVRMVEKEQLLSSSDFITLHIPFIESEGPTIAEEELQKMKENAYLINCARGGVVDESALAKALQKGWIAGAGLDVYVQEPPEDRDLLSSSKVSLTPHLGATTFEAQTRVGEQAADTLIQFFGRGE